MTLQEALRNEPIGLDESEVNQEVWGLVDCQGWNITLWVELTKGHQWRQCARITRLTKWGRKDLKFRVSADLRRASIAIATRIREQNCDIKTQEWREENNAVSLGL